MIRPEQRNRKTYLGIGKVVVIRKLILLALLILVAITGCGGDEDPTAWLQDCRRAVEDHVRASGYLHFVQESGYVLGSEQVTFEQRIDVEGDIILPDREKYEYRETLRSSLQPDTESENSFSYLTLDGGSMAYVAGESLAAQLGVAGWVYYTPPEGQNRYFDYPELIVKLTSTGEQVEWLGYEDVEGVRCVHVRYVVRGKALLDMRIQEDPAFAEQYQGLDVGELLGELQVEMWIRESDRLPQRVSMDQSAPTDSGVASSNRMLFFFTAYSEEAPLGIEAPASFTPAD